MNILDDLQNNTILTGLELNGPVNTIKAMLSQSV